jgi:hypothetical protein
LRLAAALTGRGRSAEVLVNSDGPALAVLQRSGIRHQVVDLLDGATGWESEIIIRDGVRLWVDDRLDTSAAHARTVKGHGIPLATLDDRGAGAGLADLHVAALCFDSAEPVGGQRVLRGTEYLILDPELSRHRRLRCRADRWMVAMGGTDTHGLTPKVVTWLRDAGRRATVVVGPGFRHDRELAQAAGGDFEVRRSVPSLVAEFEAHDVAITAGGISAFEANASGLPCLIVATEPWEVENARELERRGCSLFLGFRDEVDAAAAASRSIDVEAMSRAGLSQLDAQGVERVATALLAL